MENPERNFFKNTQVETSFEEVEEKSYYERRKEWLLGLLPEELHDRWDSAPLEELEKVIELRRENGYEKVLGYHVSNKDLNVGDYLRPDQSGEVFYSNDISNLYGRYAGGFLYVLEGTTSDQELNKDLGWFTTKGKVKIVDKIKITPEFMEESGARFAPVEYR